MDSIVPTPLTKGVVLKTIEKHTRDIVLELGDAPFNPAQSLRDLGATSLDIVEIVSATLRELRLRIPREQLEGLTSIEQFADKLVEFSASQTGR